jgi:tetratricopeptide (TPR) repeat protein
VSTIRFFGIICFSASLYAQLSPVSYLGGHNRNLYAAPMLTASGDVPFSDELPDASAGQPIGSVVSLRELQHPVPKKALREAYEAQQLNRASDLPKAIAKLEKAIRIHPSFRDAHCNLGVLYARAGRGPEARAELRKALDIGPPAAPIYADLALISAALRLFPEAESSALKALELDPANSNAQYVLERLVPR